jgi:hypothetical protein
MQHTCKKITKEKQSRAQVLPPLKGQEGVGSWSREGCVRDCEGRRSPAVCLAEALQALPQAPAWRLLAATTAAHTGCAAGSAEPHRLCGTSPEAHSRRCCNIQAACTNVSLALCQAALHYVWLTSTSHHRNGNARYIQNSYQITSLTFTWQGNMEEYIVLGRPSCM